MTPGTLWQPGEPGVYVGLNAESYHAAPGLNQSSLKAIERSGLHYLHATRKGVTKSPDMLMGSIVHSMILDPDKPLPHFAVRPPHMESGSREVRAWFKQQRAAGVEVLTPDQWDECVGMGKSLARHPKVRALVQSGITEVSLFWEHRCATRESLLCKARLDLVPSSNCLLDIKTTRHDARDFGGELRDRGYYIQAACYMHGWNALNPHDQRNAFLLAVVEKTAPHGVLLYNLTLGTLEAGLREYRKLIQKYTNAIEARKFAGYTEDIVPLSLPHNYAVSHVSD
jgi:hypothetical protein